VAVSYGCDGVVSYNWGVGWGPRLVIPGERSETRDPLRRHDNITMGPGSPRFALRPG